MNRLLAIFALTFASLISVAQEIKWKDLSPKTFVYQITDRQAEKLIRSRAKDSLILKMVAQEPNSSFEKLWSDRPDQGHFILANINKNKTIYKYIPVYPFQVFVFEQFEALTLQVIDRRGEIRDDATIRIKGNWFAQNKRIRYNKTSKTYTITEWSKKRERLLTVELDGFTTLIDLTKNVAERWYGGSNDSRDQYRPEFYSYMITDKNKYKPSETVRFKSYALGTNRNPLKGKLELWLEDYRRYDENRSRKIGEVEPYNPGGFAGEFTIHDSLKMTLGRTYGLQLRETSDRIVANCSFTYEDYELYDNSLNVTLKSGRQYYPHSNNLEIKATDANGLIVQDAKAMVMITTKSISNPTTNLVTIPRTVLSKMIALDNSAPTQFEIPASIFGDADCSYTVMVTVLTFDNQRMNLQRYGNFYRSSNEILFTSRGDTLRFEYRELGEIKKTAATLTYTGTELPVAVELPYETPFRQHIANYTVKVADPKIEQTFSTASLSSDFSIDGEMVGDSIQMRVINPLGLEFSWYLYQGGMLYRKGAGTELTIKHGGVDMDVVHYIDIFYTIGGQTRSFSKEFTPRKNILKVDLDLPSRAYPGQKIDAEISVKDAKGRPSANVDLTAMAANKLIKYYLPDLTDYGPKPTPRDGLTNYHNSPSARQIVVPLDYSIWRDRAALDQMDYYKFTYPWSTTFRHTVQTMDSITQFAPYVMKNGEAVNIYVISDNGTPVYFSWTSNIKGYSFPVSDTVKHNISIRLHDRILMLDSMQFEPGKKTILSIDLDHLPLNVRSMEMDNKDKYKRYVFHNDESNYYAQYISNLPLNPNLKHAYLTQGEKLYPIYHYLLAKYKSTVLSGPIPKGLSRYNSGVEYRHTGGVDYQFDSNVVYKSPMRTTPEYLEFGSSNLFVNLNQFFFSRKMLDTTLSQIETMARYWAPRSIQIVDRGIDLRFRLPIEKDSTGISNLILEDCTTKKLNYPYKIEWGNRRYKNLEPGTYDIILLYNNGKYLRYNALKIDKDVYTDLNMEIATAHAKDTLSTSLLKLAQPLVKASFDGQNRYGSQMNFRSVTSRPLNRFGNTVMGIVYDTEGIPLPGAVVQVMGSTKATYTDSDGQFEIEINGESILEFMYLGYSREKVRVMPDTQITVVLYEEGSALLDEVVITGYGSAKKSSVTGSVSNVIIRGASAPKMMLKERRNVDEEAVAVSKSVIFTENVNNEKDVSPEPSPEKAEQDRLYQEIMILGGLRSNFSDVGLWEPRLFTDREGKAKFSFTLPDNITSWEAVVYAMNNKLETGTARQSIKSYKPIMAELKTPQFLVQGDRSDFVANIRNYTDSKEIAGRVIFALGADTTLRQQVTFEASRQDKMTITAPVSDSLSATYLFTRDDGYTDGEKRSINLVPQGTLVARGELRFLENGDKFDLRAEPDEELQVKIASRQLDVYIDVANYLRTYSYDCNEQLASKLIGMINYKLYKQYKAEKFKYDSDINKIIKRLTDNQNSAKLWSWWGNSSATSYWMSAHVLRALKMARDNGYSVNLDISTLRQDYSDLESIRRTSLRDIEILHALSDWGAVQNYAPAVAKFEQEIRRNEIREDSAARAKKRPIRISYLKEKLMLWEIRQRHGLDYRSDSVSKYLRKDVLGAVGCDDGIQRYWWGDGLATTLIAYRIIKNDSALVHNKAAMQMYVLASKRSGWNTYQSASALSTIMPDLLAESATRDKPATVAVNGTEVSKFPFETKLNDGAGITIEKKTGMPLIYTSYAFKRVTKANVGEAFDVSTRIVTGDTLTAGQPVTLKVNVVVKQKNAEYVMIEVPIPAGCSYESKDNYLYRHTESHREYFKEKTVIFCERLPEGKYEFEIKLLPRYTGVYTLNPAKIEMMYFPTVNTNNGQRKVDIF